MYKNLNHVSNILWHFLGRGITEEEALRRLEKKIERETFILEPHICDGANHIREVLISSVSMFPAPQPPQPKTLQVLEPKAVCFCDIPIHNLPSHMNKFGNVGIGVLKSWVMKQQFGIRPVLYYPLVSPNELLETKLGHWKLDQDQNILLDRYLKIPTHFGPPDAEEMKRKGTETFPGIYEEREWRSFERTIIEIQEIAFVILPNRNSVNSSFEKLASLLLAPVGRIFANDLFEMETR